jgi:hypothetical protein
VGDDSWEEGAGLNQLATRLKSTEPQVVSEVVVVMRRGCRRCLWSAATRKGQMRLHVVSCDAGGVLRNKFWGSFPHQNGP